MRKYCASYRKDISNVQDMRKVRETGNLRNIYQNEINITCFQHGIAIEDLKELSRRIL